MTASVLASAASSSSSSWARSRIRRGSTSSDERVVGQQVGEQVLVGREPRQPGLHAVEGLAVGEALERLGTPRLGAHELGGACPHLLGREELACGEDRGDRGIVRGALVGDREGAEAIDLVTPQVDAHRVVVGHRVDVDDRAADGDLAPRLDLVLAPVAHRDEARDEVVAVDAVARAHDDRLDVLDVGAEALHQRAHRRHEHGRQRADADSIGRPPKGRLLRRRPSRPLDAGAQPPEDALAAAHRLERRRHPLERQRLPCGEELDLAAREERREVVHQPLGLAAGRDREEDRPARRHAGQRSDEEGARRLGDGDDLGAAEHCLGRGLVVEQPREGRERAGDGVGGDREVGVDGHARDDTGACGRTPGSCGRGYPRYSYRLSVGAGGRWARSTRQLVTAVRR